MFPQPQASNNQSNQFSSYGFSHEIEKCYVEKFKKNDQAPIGILVIVETSPPHRTIM